MDEERNTKSDNKQTELLIGFALLILGVIFACFALMQPKIDSSDKNESVSNYANYSQQSAFSSEYAQDSNYSQKSNHIAQNESEKGNDKNQNVDVSYPLNLNTCTSEELQTIDNIGKARADAIIAYRDYLGGYTSVEQLKEISGIGDSVFSSIAPYVTV